MKKLLLTLLLLTLIASPVYAINPAFLGFTKIGTQSADACSACPSAAAGADVLCEDAEGGGTLCTWTTVSTNCETGYPDSDASHRGTFACTDKESNAIEFQFNADDAAGVCNKNRTHSDNSTLYTQFYVNVYELGLDVEDTGEVALWREEDSSNNRIFYVVALYESDTTYKFKMNFWNGSTYATKTSTTVFDENTWHRVQVNYIASTSIVMKIDGTEEGGAGTPGAWVPHFTFMGVKSLSTNTDAIIQYDIAKEDNDTEPGGCPE